MKTLKLLRNAADGVFHFNSFMSKKKGTTLNGTPKARDVFLKSVDSGQFCAESHSLVSLIIHNTPVEI